MGYHRRQCFLSLSLASSHMTFRYLQIQQSKYTHTPTLTTSTSGWGRRCVAQNSALRIATGCTRSTPTAHAETRVLPLKDYLELGGTQIFSAAAAPEHPLHEGLYNPVDTRRHIHITPSSHYTALRAMIPPLLLGRSESFWLLQNFVARALTNAPPNTLLGEAHLFIQMRQTCIDRNECILLVCDVGIMWPFAHIFAQRLTLFADGVGKVRRLSLISFRRVRSWLWSELMLEWATKRSVGFACSGLEIHRGHWAHPWTRLEGVRGNPHLRTRESVLGWMRLLLRQSRRG